MTDYIVTRLRDDGCYEMSCNMMRGEAADEIERLRKEADSLKAEVQRLSQIARY